MHHKVVVQRGPVERKPYRTHCACGTGGDFGSVYDAQQYFAAHFAGLGGVSTSQFTVSEEVLKEMQVAKAEQAKAESPKPESAKAAK